VKRIWAVLSVGAAVLAVGAIALASGSEVTKATRVHVIELPKTDVVIDTGETGDTSGDLLTFHNKLLNTSRKQAGTDQGQCVRIDPAAGTWECEWTNSLEGGQISVAGPFNDNRGTVLTVTGGTGAYKNARGSMSLRFRDNGNFDFIFNLIP
jgi:allene oxide cyclase-like protein